MDGYWNMIPRGRGVALAKVFKENMKLNWKFQEGGGGYGRVQTKF